MQKDWILGGSSQVGECTSTILEHSTWGWLGNPSFQPRLPRPLQLSLGRLMYISMYLYSYAHIWMLAKNWNCYNWIFYLHAAAGWGAVEWGVWSRTVPHCPSSLLKAFQEVFGNQERDLSRIKSSFSSSLLNVPTWVLANFPSIR